MSPAPTWRYCEPAAHPPRPPAAATPAPPPAARRGRPRRPPPSPGRRRPPRRRARPPPLAPPPHRRSPPPPRPRRSYGEAFCEKYADRILPEFQTWVGELGELGATPVGFFTKLGEYLAEALRDRQADPAAYAGEKSVMQIYLSEGALSSHDEEGVIGLLTMTLMAAVFNTQVSLSWILAHLYEDPALLATARDELAGCDDLEVRVSRRPPSFPLQPPGPTALIPPSSLPRPRRATTRSWRCPSSTRASTRACGCTRCCRGTPSSAAPPRSSPSTACRCDAIPSRRRQRRAPPLFPSTSAAARASLPTLTPRSPPILQIPKDALLWLYPNAVHRDERYFPQATSFCPYRLLKGWGVDGRRPPPSTAACSRWVRRRRAARRRALPRRGGGGGGGGQRGRRGRRRRGGRGVARMEGSPLERMSDEYELVTFGHGTKRCIGEKMARAMICAFLGTVLPAVDADVPRAGLPVDDNLFDLIPASKLELRNVRPRGAAPHRGAG